MDASCLCLLPIKGPISDASRHFCFWRFWPRPARTRRSVRTAARSAAPFFIPRCAIAFICRPVIRPRMRRPENTRCCTCCTDSAGTNSRLHWMESGLLCRICATKTRQANSWSWRRMAGTRFISTHGTARLLTVISLFANLFRSWNAPIGSGASAPRAESPVFRWADTERCEWRLRIRICSVQSARIAGH